MLTLFAKYLKFDRDLLSVDLPLLVGSVFLILVTCFDGKFGLVDALLCLAGFVVYLAYTLRTPRGKKKTKLEKQISAEIKKTKKEKLSINIIS